MTLRPIVVLLLLGPTLSVCAVPAFPGAEGFGANATGGRGGDVYYVTTLEDGVNGSLRSGITHARGPRTILFRVSGTIHLTSNLNIKRPNITIAGQSAPGDGICLADNSFTIDDNDVIVRHIRSRLGTKYDQQEDALTVQGGTNVIVDHCSASWSVDETLSVVGQAQFVTVQWCYITESLNQSVHKKGAHGYGSLIRPRQDASYTFHHNLYAHHSSRNPRPGTYNGKTLRFDFRNNVIYDWGFKAGYDNFTNEFVEMNYVNNYLVAGPSTSWFEGAFDGIGFNTLIYQHGNRFDINRDGQVNGTNSGWGMFSGKFTKAEVPFAAPEVYSDAAEVGFQRVLAQAGATPWRRDPVDTRVTGTVRSQSGRIINTTDDAGGWPELKSEEPPADTDNDGMPDYWERALGLNPNAANNNEDRDHDGYTNLEEYLNWLAGPHAVTSRNAPAEINLAETCGRSRDLSFNASTGENGSVRLLKDHHTSRFEPKKNFNGLASFTVIATDSVTRVSFGPMKVGVLVMNQERSVR